MTDSVIDDLASLCLHRMQEEGQQVLEEICEQHPDHAEEIRGMVSQLLKLGLLEASPGAQFDRIGEYRIVRRLGGGGMGVVYLAIQESLGRQVALKIMHPGFGLREKSRARFRREIEAISAIDHPGVCTVYEAGEADGVPYLAMRYIEGETLAQILNGQRREKRSGKTPSTGGSQDIHQILECSEKALRALHCAHEAGLVHRDVKPGNIMIDQLGEPVILDFGLVQDTGLDAHDLTASGDLLGTPPYMSPEQVEGRIVDRRSDVYSLAVTLYECLTLRTPFEGKNRQIIYNKILADPPPDPRKQNRSIGRELWIVLSKALEKDPKLRFDSALELADELGRIRRREPIQTVRASLPTRALRWTQRNRAATAVLITVSIALFLTLWFLRRSQDAETRLTSLSLLGEAMDLKDRDTALAFKVAREAWLMDPSHPDPRLQGRMQGILQDIMVGLVPHKVLARGKTVYDRVLYSSGGKFLLIMGRDQSGILCKGDGQRIDLVLPKARTRAFPGAFSPDEKELAIADRDGRILRFDLTTSPPTKIWESAEPVHPLVWMVAYHHSPEARHLLVCSTREQPVRDGTKASITEASATEATIAKTEDARQGEVLYDNRATVWNLAGKEPVDLHVLTELPWHSGAWLEDGRFVAVGSLWETDGTRIRVLDARKESADAVAVEASHRRMNSPQDINVRRVIVGPGHFSTITQWGDLHIYRNDGTLVRSVDFDIRKEKDKITEAFFDPQGRSILVTSQDGQVRLLDLQTGRPAQVDLEFHPRRSVLAGALSRNGDRITVGNWAGRVGVWDRQGTRLDDFLAHANGIAALVYSPDEKYLLTAGFGGVVKLWDMEKHASKRMLRGYPWPRFAVSPDGRLLAIIDQEGRLTLSDDEGRVVPQGPRAFQSPYKGVTTVSFSPDGKRLLLHTLGQPVLVHDLEGHSPIRKGPRSNRSLVARFLDSNTVLVTNTGNRQGLRTWNLETGQVQKLYELPEDKSYDRPLFTSSAVSENGQEIAIADRTGWAFVLDRSGKRLWTSPRQVGLIRELTLSKDARYVLVATEDGNAYLWHRETGNVQTYGPQSSGVMEAVFSPDETQVVLGYKSGRIRIWNRETGERELELAGHGGQQIHSLGYTRSGYLVTAGADASIRWWWTDVASLDAAIRAVDIPELTDAERRQFPDLAHRRSSVRRSDR